MSSASLRSRAEASGSFIERAVPWIVTVCSAVAFAAAVVLLVEKLMLIGDPDYVPTCSINPVLSCGSIMESEQAEAFGFPNPILGVAGFGLFALFGVGLALGARPARWVWLLAQAGATFAFGFVCWLIFQSLYRIEALCPYCMVVWVAVFVLFWYLTLFNLVSENLRLPTRLRPLIDGAVAFHGAILTAAFLLLIAMIGEAFWSYWETLI